MRRGMKLSFYPASVLTVNIVDFSMLWWAQLCIHNHCCYTTKWVTDTWIICIWYSAFTLRVFSLSLFSISFCRYIFCCCFVCRLKRNDHVHGDREIGMVPKLYFAFNLQPLRYFEHWFLFLIIFVHRHFSVNAIRCVFTFCIHLSMWQFSLLVVEICWA